VTDEFRAPVYMPPELAKKLRESVKTNIQAVKPKTQEAPAMSRTFSLVCHVTKEYVGVGQGPDNKTVKHLWYTPTHAENVRAFYNSAFGKEIVLMDDEDFHAHYETNEYKEYCSEP
jgi:hypothetical protein